MIYQLGISPEAPPLRVDQMNLCMRKEDRKKAKQYKTRSDNYYKWSYKWRTNKNTKRTKSNKKTTFDSISRILECLRASVDGQ